MKSKSSNSSVPLEEIIKHAIEENNEMIAYQRYMDNVQQAVKETRVAPGLNIRSLGDSSGLHAQPGIKNPKIYSQETDLASSIRMSENVQPAKEEPFYMRRQIRKQQRSNKVNLNDLELGGTVVPKLRLDQVKG